jgi:MFS family permease
MADIIGRRLAFNCTLFMVGIFLIAAGGNNNIYTYGAMMALVGFGSGGNLPVARYRLSRICSVQWVLSLDNSERVVGCWSNR